MNRSGEVMRNSRGHSAIEFMVATVILGLALIPMFGIFSRSREATFKSKISYMALHVARERLEELRQVPFFQLENLATTDWVRADGYAFKHTMETRNQVFGADKGKPYGDLEDDQYKYPKQYTRIWTKIDVEGLERVSFASDAPIVDPGNLQASPDIHPFRLKRVTLSYYWQEKGDVLDDARMKHYNEITTIIGSHNVR